MGDVIIWVFGAISAGLVFLTKHVFQKLASKTKNAIYKKVTEKAEEITLSVIHTTEEAIMKEARADLADGKIDKEEFRRIGIKAKTVAIDAIIKQIGEPLKEVLDSTIIEVKIFLSKLIEEKIDEVKK